jgi:hypothetical protein
MAGTRGPSCRVPSRLVRRRKRRPAGWRDPAIGWDALGAAVAVLTARQDDAPDLRGSIVRTYPVDRVVLGLEIVASAALTVLMPEDSGARALESLGLLALEKGAQL